MRDVKACTPQRRTNAALNTQPFVPKAWKGSAGNESDPVTSKRKRGTFRSVVAILCAVVLSPGDTLAHPCRPLRRRPRLRHRVRPRLHLSNWIRLWSPIALYPDPLLAQTLAASTYPLEIIQLQQWLDRILGRKPSTSYKNTGSASIPINPGPRFRSKTNRDETTRVGLQR